MRRRWPGHVTHVGSMRNAYRTSVGIPERKTPVGKTISRLENNSKMVLRGMGWDCVYWDSSGGCG
jgi:hypothetical protein